MLDNTPRQAKLKGRRRLANPSEAFVVAAPDENANPTLSYYARHAAEYAAKTDAIDMAALYAQFAPCLSKDSLILDLGCGGGRDARHFASLGHRVVGLDPCLELLAEARRRTNGERIRRISYVVGAMPDLPFQDSIFSAIWACSSMLHLPRGLMLPALHGCRKAMITGGHLWLSVKKGEGERDDEGRFCTLWKAAELVLLVTDAGFDILEAMERFSLDGRQLTWVTLLARAC